MQPRFRRFLQFRFTTLLGLMTGIAIGFAPLKLWEVWRSPAPMISLQMQFVEVENGFLDELLAANDSKPDSDTPLIDRDGSLIERLRQGQSSDAVQIVSAPSLMTIDGQSAQIAIGSQIPIMNNGAVEYRDVGCQYKVTPKRLRNGQIHLDLALELSQVDPALTANLNESQIPGFKKHKIASQINLIPGQTVLASSTTGSLNQSAQPNRQTLILITARPLDPTSPRGPPGPLPLTASATR